MKPNLVFILIASLGASLGACLGTLVGCSAGAPPEVDTHSQADFINGDFEAGSLSAWTVTPHLNSTGIGVLPPQQVSDLTLKPGGDAARTKIVMGATPESVLAAGLQAGDTLMYPRFGKYSAVINELGNGGNANELLQTLTTTAADVDPQDGNIHVRFVLAPVLQNPGHADNLQPYFYLELRNTTKNTVLFSSFNFSNQQGIPYKSSGSGAVQYTDWQLFDVAPGPLGLAVGDTVVMDIIAAGCQPGGHWGHLYVDGFGAFIPGLTVFATAAQAAVAGADLTYTFHVNNGGGAAAPGVVVDEVTPPGTTFASVLGATCSTPAVGATGTISCTLGTLNAAASTTFQVTVHINPTASGTISNGSYQVQGTGVSPLIGPLVTTTILQSYLITATVPGGNGTILCPSPVPAGGSSVCTITPAVGYGLAALTLDGSDVLAGVSGNTFSIPNVGASHTLQGSFGGVARYNIAATVAGGNGLLSCQSPVAAGASSVCTIAPAAGYGLSVLTLDGVNVTAEVSGNTFTIGGVMAAHAVQAAFVPAMYVITTSVPSGNGTLTCMNPLTSGASSVCTITAVSGFELASLFLDGLDVFSGISGSTYTIRNVMAPHLLQGVFTRSLYNITASVPGGNGVLSCQSPVLNGASAVCTITPAAGFVLAALTRDGTDVFLGVTGNIYTLGNVTATHAVQATFAPALYDIAFTVPGGNGTLACASPLGSGMSSLCSITPAVGYGLASLTVDGASVLAGVVGNTFTLLNVTAPHLVQATFSQSAYNVTATVPAGNGTLSCQSPVAYGTSSVCTLKPAVGFALAALTVDGISALAELTGNAYLIANVMTSHVVVAAFAPALFNITASVPGGNGTVVCQDVVAYGGSAGCTITPAAGYVLSGLTVDGNNVYQTSVLGVYTYTISNVTASHLVQGNFATAPYSVNGTVAGGNGAITCASPVLYGRTAVCQISPMVGFWLQTLTLDGISVIAQVTGNSLTIPNVTANHTVQGTFALSTYQVTVSMPGGNGSVTCSTPISQGGSGTCTIVPATGYLLGTLTLDGADVLATVVDGSLAVANVTAPHAVQATFIQTTNLITVALAGGLGTVSCSNPVVYAQAAVCQLIPAPGYRLTGLLLDGTSILAQLNGNSFVIGTVVTPHTVQATFTLIPKYDITVNVLGNNGTITCTTPIPEGKTPAAPSHRQWDTHWTC